MDNIPNRNCLALAGRLDRVASGIECQGVRCDGVIGEDTVALLRWAAQYLRKPGLLDADLEGVLMVFRRVLPGFNFRLSENRVVPFRRPAAPRSSSEPSPQLSSRLLAG